MGVPLTTEAMLELMVAEAMYNLSQLDWFQSAFNGDVEANPELSFTVLLIGLDEPGSPPMAQVPVLLDIVPSDAIRQDNPGQIVNRYRGLAEAWQNGSQPRQPWLVLNRHADNEAVNGVYQLVDCDLRQFSNLLYWRLVAALAVTLAPTVEFEELVRHQAFAFRFELEL